MRGVLESGPVPNKSRISVESIKYVKVESGQIVTSQCLYSHSYSHTIVLWSLEKIAHVLFVTPSSSQSTV